MKTFISIGILILIFFTPTINGQVGFEQNQIADLGGTYGSLFTVDIDNDGDKDILVGKSVDGVAWFENIDGLGTFGPGNQITTLNAPYSIYPADVDNDGDLDIFTKFNYNPIEIGWYENTDGQGTFSEVHNIETLSGVNSHILWGGDLDNDQDMDFVMISDGYHTGPEDTGFWYENINGFQSFEKHEIEMQEPGSLNTAELVDVDQDGDLDLLTSSSNASGQVAWYENIDGAGNFSEPIQINNPDNYHDVYLTDLDGDGDKDAVYITIDKIYVSKNLDGQGDFGETEIISTDISTGRGVYAGDLDGDLDNDVISISFSDGKLAWYENLDGKVLLEHNKLFH